MGSCCSREVSPVADLDLPGVSPRRGRGKGTSPRAIAGAQDKSGRLEATTTHRLTYHVSSGSTESLTNIAGAVADVRKGFEQERNTHSSSENSGSQLHALPSSSAADGAPRTNGGQPGHPIPREGDGVEYNPNPPHGAMGRGGSHTICSGASEQRSQVRHASNGFVHTTQPTNGTAAMGASSSPPPSPSLNAFPASPLTPVRRGPKQALLSYAEQYRTLQPFLQRRLRNRRWRLVFSSDVHGSHLVDRCQRALHEEDAQWRAFAAARAQQQQQQHHGASRTNSEQLQMDDASGGGSGSNSGGATTSPSAAVPVLALMETTFVVPAPRKFTASARTSTQAINDVQAAAAAEGEEHQKNKSSMVVDSHLCIGLYLQRCPAPDTVGSYRRSEILFFLFQSPIQPTSSVEASLLETGTAVTSENNTSSPQPAVSAPPPSITRTSRRRPNASDEDVSATVTRNPADESADAQRTSTRSSSSGTLAPTPGKGTATPRTQTHRRINVSGSGVQAVPYNNNTNNSNISSNEDLDDEMHAHRRSEEATAAGGERVRGYEPTRGEEEEEEEAAFTALPPHVSATNVTREQRHYDASSTEAWQNAFDRHGAAVEERRRCFQNGSSTAMEVGEESRLSAPAEAPNGILSAQWQHRVGEIEQQRQQQQQERQILEGGKGESEAFTSRGVLKSPSGSPAPAHGDGNQTDNMDDDADTFSSASGAAASRGERHPSDDAPRRSVTRRPVSAISVPPVSSHSDEKSSSPLSMRSLKAAGVRVASPVLAIAVPSPNSPHSSPHSAFGWAGPPAAHVAAPYVESVFAMTPLNVPRNGNVLSPTNVDLHPLHLYDAGNSLTMEDDLVSATTTVVSATSVPGGGLTWREDEDLSSYWPEGPHGSTTTYNLNNNNNNNNASGGNLNGNGTGSSRTRGGRRRQEWYSPATGPQLLPPLSRTSSFGGDDTAECLTPRCSRDTLPAHATSAFAAANDNNMNCINHNNNNTTTGTAERQSSGVSSDAHTSSPLPGLTHSGASTGVFASVSMNSTNNFTSLPPPQTVTGTASTTSAVGTGMEGVALAGGEDVPAFNTSASSAFTVGGNSMTDVTHVSSPAPSVRPVSTHVEVLPMTPWCDTYAASAVANTAAGADGHAVHSELPSRTNSDLALTEGTLDVYCTSTGAVYVWDPHREGKAREHDGDGGDAPHVASGEHEFVYQRDANGIRWNIGYFMRHGYFSDDVAASVAQAHGSPHGSPLGETGYASLFAYVRAHARREQSFAAAAEARQRSETTDGSTDEAMEVFTSSLVKMQLCAISSRTMPTLFQRTPSGAVSAM